MITKTTWKEIEKDIGDLIQRNVFHSRAYHEIIKWIDDPKLDSKEIKKRINYIIQLNEMGGEAFKKHSFKDYPGKTSGN